MEVENGGPSASGRRLGWPHAQFPVPGMRSSKMATGSGRAAIFHLNLNGDRKVLPSSWLTLFPAPPSWNQDGGATSNAWRTLELPWNPQKGVVLVQKRPVDVWSYFFFLLFEKHLIVSLPQTFSKWLREFPACHYGEVNQSARVNTTFHETWCWLRQAPTLLFFGFYVFFFLTVLYNSKELLYSTVS